MMKKFYAIACLSFGVFVSHAQTFSPAVKSGGTNTFTYDFSQVKGNSSKQIDFTISGVTNGTSFTATLNQNLDNMDGVECGITYGEPNYVIIAGETGKIAINKGTISVQFSPKDFIYDNPIYYNNWGGLYFDHCEQDTYVNLGIKTATMTVTFNYTKPVSYTFNLSGNSVSVITALENDNKFKTNSATLFYPNPVKDVLFLNQEATVYDAFGKTILSGKGSIDVSGMHSGIYFVQSAGQRQKFVKE